MSGDHVCQDREYGRSDGRDRPSRVGRARRIPCSKWLGDRRELTPASAVRHLPGHDTESTSEQPDVRCVEGASNCPALAESTWRCPLDLDASGSSDRGGDPSAAHLFQPGGPRTLIAIPGFCWVAPIGFWRNVHLLPLEEYLVIDCHDRRVVWVRGSHAMRTLTFAQIKMLGGKRALRDLGSGWTVMGALLLLTIRFNTRWWDPSTHGMGWVLGFRNVRSRQSAAYRTLVERVGSANTLSHTIRTGTKILAGASHKHGPGYAISHALSPVPCVFRTPSLCGTDPQLPPALAILRPSSAPPTI